MTDIDTVALTLFQNASQKFDARVQGNHLMCDIYDAYGDPDDDSHNSLGCNFDAITQQISILLRIGAKEFSRDGAFSLYALLINTLWERMTDVFNIVSMHEGYRKRHYEPMYQMRRWANFFKHPKEFGWLVHHPQYLFDRTEEATEFFANNRDFRVIDDGFVKKYYTADRVKGLATEFKGYEQSVAVRLPNVADITDNLCGCLVNFVDVVTKNPVFYEILNDKATIVNYFDSLVETDGAKPTEQNAAADGEGR